MSRVRFDLNMAEALFDFVVETMDLGSDVSADEVNIRVLIEKKTVLNLIDAFCVSIKHYLRGEDGMLSIYRSLARCLI
jgi:putative membrane protein